MHACGLGLGFSRLVARRDAYSVLSLRPERVCHAAFCRNRRHKNNPKFLQLLRLTDRPTFSTNTSLPRVCKLIRSECLWRGARLLLPPIPSLNDRPVRYPCASHHTTRARSDVRLCAAQAPACASPRLEWSYLRGRCGLMTSAGFPGCQGVNLEPTWPRAQSPSSQPSAACLISASVTGSFGPYQRHVCSSRMSSPRMLVRAPRDDRWVGCRRCRRR